MPVFRPIIAILRGITPPEVVTVSQALIESGICMIEVPLNSRSAYDSISALVEAVGSKGLVGAGTVTNTREVQSVKSAGSQFVVSPNTDAGVIRATKNSGMQSFPGCLTPSECFNALGAGADGLKLFPSFILGTNGLKAIRSILPVDTQVFMVGNIFAGVICKWLGAGADGFGIGSALYAPGRSVDDISSRANAIVSALDDTCRDQTTDSR